MSVGHEEPAMSEVGIALIQLRSALRNLAERLANLRNWQEAERIARQLRS
ncbi:hypothetical protein [Palleronia sp.]